MRFTTTIQIDHDIEMTPEQTRVFCQRVSAYGYFLIQGLTVSEGVEILDLTLEPKVSPTTE